MTEKKPRVKNQTKAAGTLGLAGAMASYLTVLGVKYGVDPTLSTIASAAVVGWLGHWAGKLTPH